MSDIFPHLSRRTNRQIQLVGWYQVVGGIVGIGFLIWVAIATPHYSLAVTGAFTLAFLLFFLSIYAGRQLLRSPKKGIILSLVNQCLQAIGFAYAGYAFQYSSGAYLSLGLNMTESFDIIFGAGISKCNFSIGTAAPEKILMINLVPIVLISLLEKLKADVNKAAADQSLKH